MRPEMADQLRAVMIGALIAIVGVLVGSTEGVPSEGKLIAAAVLGIVAVAVGIRPEAIRGEGSRLP
jgi:hypothetical protein